MVPNWIDRRGGGRCAELVCYQILRMSLECYGLRWWCRCWCSRWTWRRGRHSRTSPRAVPCSRWCLDWSSACYRLRCYHIDGCRCCIARIGLRSDTLVFAYLALRKASFRSTGLPKWTCFSARMRKMVRMSFQHFPGAIIIIGDHHQQKYKESRFPLNILLLLLWRQVDEEWGPW